MSVPLVVSEELKQRDTQTGRIALYILDFVYFDREIIFLGIFMHNVIVFFFNLIIYELFDKFSLATPLHCVITISILPGDIKCSMGLQMYTNQKIELQTNQKIEQPQLY